MKKFYFLYKIPIFLFVTVWLFISCSLGKMTVQELHYFAVPNGANTNYYRLKVEAKTKLGKAEYRSGWFPTRSLDMLFGDVSSAGGVKALEVRNKLQEQINEKILSTNAAWLKEASKAKPIKTKLIGLFNARRRILAYPRTGIEPFMGGFEIEYNPALGVAIHHADEKLVFMLSSNPDEVIGRIANFTENEKTVLAINQLSNVVGQRVKNEIAAQQAVEEVDKLGDALIHSQIQQALAIAENPNATKEEAILEINTLINLLDSMQP